MCYCTVYTRIIQRLIVLILHVQAPLRVYVCSFWRQRHELAGLACAFSRCMQRSCYGAETLPPCHPEPGAFVEDENSCVPSVCICTLMHAYGMIMCE